MTVKCWQAAEPTTPPHQAVQRRWGLRQQSLPPATAKEGRQGNHPAAQNGRVLGTRAYTKRRRGGTESRATGGVENGKRLSPTVKSGNGDVAIQATHQREAHPA